MRLLSIIRPQANLEIGNVTEVAHDSARGGDEDFATDHGVSVFLVGTLTEGSVKISPIFRGYFYEVCIVGIEYSVCLGCRVK